MSIYHIDINNSIKTQLNWDLDEINLNEYKIIDDSNYGELVEQLSKDSHYLQQIEIDILLDYFDKLALKWLDIEDSEFLNKFSTFSISFLINFMRRKNLEPILEISLKNNIKYLDEFVLNKLLNRQLRALPRGVLTHWISGNVPVLGMISLLQGIVTKNVNIIKLPKRNGQVLPNIIKYISEFNYEKNGKYIEGKKLIKSILCVYVSKDDLKSQKNVIFK